MAQFKTTKNYGFMHYFYCNDTLEMQKTYANLKSKFMPLIKQHFPHHYMLERCPSSFLEYLDEQNKTHLFFLRFNIRNLYPSIARLDIGPVLVDNYEELTGCSAPTSLSQWLHLGFDSKFTGNSNFSSMSGLTADLEIDARCLGTPCRHGLYQNNKLSHLVAAAYILGLCQALSRWPFLCFRDDFVVLFRSRAEIAECLLLVYLKLHQIGLELNPDCISSGRVYQDGFLFMGYRYKENTFGISQETEKAFRHQIIRLTTFNRSYKNQQAFIKQLNRQITVFGHYYKHGQEMAAFIRLDTFIRKRVRQYLFLAGDMKDRADNLPKGSDALYSELGLCSLVSIGKAKNTKMVNYSSANANSQTDLCEAPVYNKEKVDKLLQQTLIRYKYLCRQQKVVIDLLEHVAPLSDEISAQPGISFGIF